MLLAIAIHRSGPLDGWRGGRDLACGRTVLAAWCADEVEAEEVLAASEELEVSGCPNASSDRVRVLPTR
jgi:hypothetical protein